MTDKEKQIEEMARVIGHCYCDKECQNKCAYCDISSLNEAKKLYENGFRKLPEDSVVLSREEWKQIKNSLYYSKEALEKKLAQASKETAEKIYRMADEICTGSQNDGDNILAMIKDKFGVEIKE